MLKVNSNYSFDFTGALAPRNGIFTVLGITSQDAMSGMGVDIKQKVFLDLGYSENDYSAWLNTDRLVYTITNDQGRLIVPSSIFTSTEPEVTFPYTQHLLVIQLGYLNETEQAALAALKTRVDHDVKEVLGVDRASETKSYGEVKLQTQSEHDTIVSTRADRISNAKATRPTPEELERENTELKALLTRYELLIKDKVLTP